MDKLDIIIESSLNLFCKVLNVKVAWDFADKVKKGSEFITATHIEEEKTIIINPDIMNCYHIDDVDIIEHLESIENVSGYIKQLIKNDIKETKK